MFVGDSDWFKDNWYLPKAEHYLQEIPNVCHFFYRRYLCNLIMNPRPLDSKVYVFRWKLITWETYNHASLYYSIVMKLSNVRHVRQPKRILTWNKHVNAFYYKKNMRKTTMKKCTTSKTTKLIPQTSLRSAIGCRKIEGFICSYAMPVHERC